MKEEIENPDEEQEEEIEDPGLGPVNDKTASFKSIEDIVARSKKDYKAEVETYPVAFVHLPVGDMDVIVGPKKPEELMVGYDVLGIDIKIPKNVRVDRSGKPDPKAILSMMEGDSDMVSDFKGNLSKLKMFEACSMTRTPKIHPTPLDDNLEPLPQDDEKRNENWWYWDDLHELDQEPLLALTRGKGIEVSPSKNFHPRESIRVPARHHR